MAGPLDGELRVEHLLEHARAAAAGPQVDFGVLVGVDGQLDLPRRAGDLHRADDLVVAAIEPAGDAQHGGHLADAQPIVVVEAAEVVVLVLRLDAAMVAGDVGDDLQLLRPERLQAAVQDEMVRVLVMALVADEVADVLHAGRGLEQPAVAGRQLVELAQAVVDLAGELGDLARVGEVDAARFGEAIDLLVLARRARRLRRLAGASIIASSRPSRTP